MPDCRIVRWLIGNDSLEEMYEEFSKEDPEIFSLFNKKKSLEIMSKWRTLGIFDASGKILQGTVCFDQDDLCHIFVFKDFRYKGIVRTIIDHCCDFVFESLESIKCVIPEDKKISLRIALLMGFTVVGENEYGKIYGLERRDWMVHRAKK